MPQPTLHIVAVGKMAVSKAEAVREGMKGRGWTLLHSYGALHCWGALELLYARAACAMQLQLHSWCRAELPVLTDGASATLP